MVLVPVLDLRRDGRYHLQAYLARPEHSSPGVDTFTRRGQVRWLPLTGTAATGRRVLLRISLSANRSDPSRVRSGICRHQRCHTLSTAAKTDPAWQLNLTPGPVAGVQIGSKVSTSQAPLIFCSPTRTELAVLVGAAGADLLIDEGLKSVENARDYYDTEDLDHTDLVRYYAGKNDVSFQDSQHARLNA